MWPAVGRGRAFDVGQRPFEEAPVQRGVAPKRVGTDRRSEVCLLLVRFRVRSVDEPRTKAIHGEVQAGFDLSNGGLEAHPRRAARRTR